jgi:UDP-N-acetylmuramoyl-L-alanyl-D-glutamate--2,6-diaminopimelate ligase
MTGFVRQTLAQLFAELPQKPLFPEYLPDVAVTGIAFDSRAVQQGNLFVALVGGSVDGHRYINHAVERGAAAVIGMEPDPGVPIPYIQVRDSREALAYISAAFYGYPARQMTVIGVTGTDGKTTTSNLIYHILIKAGLWAGMISTINAVIGKETIDTGFHVTTPEAPDVQRYLARMVNAGLSHVILESTSHGLAQHRVSACEFDIAVVTNITHEHLDYHGTYDAYRASKARLFTGLEQTKEKKSGNPRLAILNRDDQSYDYLHNLVKSSQITYGLNPKADVYAKDISYDASGIHFTAVTPNDSFQVDSPLVGEFNVYNCLAALSITVVGLQIPVNFAQQGLAELKGVPGRMERIDLGQPFTAIVDFAHTPNALKVALETVQKVTQGRVLAVFGSAGLRDRQKRRMMAEVALEHADLTFLTAEDPRTESLDEILAEMAQAAVGKGGREGENFWRIPDRGQAIRTALEMAQPGDLVIACGKGHEQSMCFGTKEYLWDDRLAMRAALAQMLGMDGPEMPYLPTQE